MAVSNPAAGALTDEQQRLLKSWLADFDSSWRPGALVGRVDQLPPAPDGLRTAALIALVKADLRKRWQRGDAVGIEFYLGLFPELGTTDTAPTELVRAEYALRQQAGDEAGLAELRQRFPRQIEQLRQSIAAAPSATSQATAGTIASRAEGLVTPPYVPSAHGGQPAGTVDNLDGEHGTEMVSRPKAPPAPGSLPEQFGRYRIVRRLGQGGMGSVYLAHDSQLDRQVALKVPLFGPSDGPRVLERFSREARAAAQLRHPNICPIYDVGEINGIHYLTMAYIEGRPLSDVVKSGQPQAQAKAAALVRKLALALEVAHAAGVIHRDLKPANVMLHKDGEPAIMDFGLAKRLPDPARPDEGDARLTRDGAILGTPSYMPPEQVQGDVDAIGPASDVYSLGVILYELLTGRLPFEGSVTSVLAQILTKEPERPSALRPDLRPELEKIVLKAIAKQAGHRFGTMAAFAAALTDFLKAGVNKAAAPKSVRPAEAEPPTLLKTVIEEPPAARRTRAREQPLVRPGRGRVLAAAGGAALLLGGIIVVIIFKQEDRKPDDNPKVAKADEMKGAPINEPPLRGTPTGGGDPKAKEGGSAAKKLDPPMNQKGPDKIEPPTKRPPQREPDYTNAPELEGLKLPFAAAWDTRGFEPFFRVKSATYDEAKKQLTWTVETKRGFGRLLISSETRLDVDFLDDAGVRHDRLEYRTGRGLDYVPETEVKQNDVMKIVLRFPQSRSGMITTNTASVVIRDSNKPAAGNQKPPDPAPVVAKEVPKKAEIPAKQPDLTNAPELKGVEFPFHASWDTTAFRSYFKVTEATYDPAKKELTWTVVTTRGFRDSVSWDTKLEVDFYDAEDVRLDRLPFNAFRGLKYTPDKVVSQGSKVKITLSLQREDILRKTARVVLIDRNKKVMLPKQPVPQEPGPAKDPAFASAPELEGRDLPVQATWDTRALRSYFTVLLASYDAENKELSWLLDAKRGFRDSVSGDTKLEVDFYDAAGVRLDRLPFNAVRGLKYTPESDLAERSRVRITLHFVHEEILRNTARVVIIDLSKKGLPSPPEAKNKQPADLAPELKDIELPFQATWDTRPFGTYFTVRKATYDPETRELKWTLEAKRGFGSSVALDTKLTFEFQDDEGVDLYRNRIGFGPGGDISLEFKPVGSVKRGDALHLLMRFPTGGDLKKTVRVILIDGNKPAPKKK